jgi:ribosomal protein S18 acetylase RimI-like enzyme
VTTESPIERSLPHFDGIEWRPAAPSDVADLEAHMRRIHAEERLSFVPKADFFRWLLDQPGITPDDDTRVAIRDGRIVADCGTWLHTSDRGARCFVWAETSPGSEHLRPGMLDWVTARARHRLVESGPGPKVMRLSVEEHRSGLQRDAETAGFTSGRSFVEMARPLTSLPGLPQLQPGFEVVPWSDALEEPTRHASNDAFLDHWGSLPMTAEEFSGFYRDSPTFRPDLSFLALSGTDVVSFCLCEVDDDDNAERDTNDVYIQRVGTRSEFRGTGLASHLIIRALQAAAEVPSLDRAALEVDETSHTGATAVYERLGFETYARSLSYVIELAD